MEVNKDEALRCLDIARRHLGAGNFASARKFGQKSISLYPTPEAKAFISRVDSYEAAASNSGTTASPSASTSSASTSSSRRSADTTPAKPRAAPAPVEREYTVEQVAAVKAIRSSGGDFYKVLGVQKTAIDIEIKKAYRKLALQMHPDKNGAPGADEAFKIVSKAFTVLSDPQKRAVFDQYGPEDANKGRSSGVNYDRSQPAGHSQSPFARGGGMHGFGEEMSPEDLFNMFFGGGGFQQYGGRSRAHQAQTQRQQQHYRQQQQQQQQQQEQQRRQRRAAAGGGSDAASSLGSIIQLLPLIVLIIVSISSGLFSGQSSSNSHGSQSIINDFSLRPRDQFTTARHTTFRKVPYYVNQHRFMGTYFPGQKFEWAANSRHQLVVKPDQVTQQGQKVGPLFKRMEDQVEVSYLREMQSKCKEQRRKREILQNKAMGFWGADRKLWLEAQKMAMPACDVIREKYGKEHFR